jgi:sec-independent protein translocase protein TatC
MSALRKLRIEAPTLEQTRLGSMSFLAHLEELRRRIIRAAAGIGIGMVVAFWFIDRLVGFVLEPARRMLPAGAKLIYTNPSEAFSLYVYVAMLAGALIASPFLMFQVWRFIAPGLYTNEKRFAIPFIALTSAGALAGAAFSHYIVYPSMIAFFGTFSSPDLAFMPRVEDAFDLYVHMLLGMVAVFQIPTVVFFLARMGLVTAKWLWRNIRYAVLIIFIVAAVLTPSSDPWNQMVFAAPMFALYVFSILLAWAVAPRVVQQFDGREVGRVEQSPSLRS